MANILRYALVDDPGFIQEVEVDEVACNGYFVMTTHNGVTELIPGHRLSQATVLPVEDEGA